MIASPSDVCTLDLGNLLSGFLGAALGVSGAVGLQRLQWRRDKTAAARATFTEV